MSTLAEASPVARSVPVQGQSASSPKDETSVLDAIARRVLWLAVNIVHHANHVTAPADGSKVGGHQASAASVVHVLTALYFHHLRANDRVSIKPHASPAFHAVQYLLGRLDQRYLTTLRSLGGLQAYPSRTKDPVQVDFSTGSVGLGAVAPLFSALTKAYVRSHFGHVTSGRFFAVIGDAELDEGNVWEAVHERALNGIADVTWIVDVNRQSLDVEVPKEHVEAIRLKFQAAGWNVIEVKWGRALADLIARPGGAELERVLDSLSSSAYHRLIRTPAADVSGAVTALAHPVGSGLAALLASLDGAELARCLADLGGHDIPSLILALDAARAETSRPSVILAHTIKGWGLPTAGDPGNHSRLLTQDDVDRLGDELGVLAADTWRAFPVGSPEQARCVAAEARLREHMKPAPRLTERALPTKIELAVQPTMSTQQAFGRLMMSLGRSDTLASRIVTVSPDVASSTGLAGWVKRFGTFEPEGAEIDPGATGGDVAPGRHIQLGISEMNLFMLLGALGLSSEHSGQQLVPVGTVYDPFVCRGLDAFIHGVYSGSRFIVVGTPSGVTLSPEGGAHQSTITPSIGMELPGLNFYEPCYAGELAWQMLDAIRQCIEPELGRSAYLRLSTKPVDQGPFEEAKSRLGEERLHLQVLAGGYRILDSRYAHPRVDQRRAVNIAAVGAMVPEAVTAGRRLWERGVACNVLAITNARSLYESWRENVAGREPHGPFDWLMPRDERRAPIVTVADAASHSLAWIGAVHGAQTVPLGVDEFGQSAERNAVYRRYGIDADAITDAALYALGRR